MAASSTGNVRYNLATHASERGNRVFDVAHGSSLAHLLESLHLSELVIVLLLDQESV